MSSPDEFARRIRIRGDNIVANTSKLVRMAALAADQAVVMGTPVDTGAARSNWIANLDTPNTEAIPAYSPGSGGTSSGPNTQAALEQARQVIAAYKGGPNASIYLSNNLPYIAKLDDGWSPQAPAGFVEAAVDAAFRAVRKYAQGLSD